MCGTRGTDRGCSDTGGFMKSTFQESDVVLLLKDITGLVEPLPAEIREHYIQNGVHYCEMLPLEYEPSPLYMIAYKSALENYAKATAAAIASLAEKIYAHKGSSIVIVSLARAGTPIGVLIKRYLEKKYCVKLMHYSISIIRGRGIDRNALDYILTRHKAESLQFVDGWTGKGAILGELAKELREYPQLKPELAVVSDPANLTDLCGTHEDFLIPSSCLNATVTGLVSRTFLRSDIIGDKDFHGAAFLGELADSDLTEEYLTAIEREFDYDMTDQAWNKGVPGTEVVHKIAAAYAVDDINFIKPGIGETTRVLLRRIPWKVLINQKHSNKYELCHIVQLAKDKGVPIESSSVDLGNYKVCGIIRNLADT